MARIEEALGWDKKKIDQYLTEQTERRWALRRLAQKNGTESQLPDLMVLSKEAEDRQVKILQELEDIEFSERRIRQINYQLSRLIAKKEKYEFLGTDKGSRTWRGLLWDIDNLNKELAYHKKVVGEE